MNKKHGKVNIDDWEYYPKSSQVEAKPLPSFIKTILVYFVLFILIFCALWFGISV